MAMKIAIYLILYLRISQLLCVILVQCYNEFNKINNYECWVLFMLVSQFTHSIKVLYCSWTIAERNLRNDTFCTQTSTHLWHWFNTCWWTKTTKALCWWVWMAKMLINQLLAVCLGATISIQIIIIIAKWSWKGMC